VHALAKKNGGERSDTVPDVKITIDSAFLLTSTDNLYGVGDDVTNRAFAVLHELGHAMARQIALANPLGWMIFSLTWDGDAQRQALTDKCFK